MSRDGRRQRLLTGVAHVRARLAELVPHAADRCGVSPAAGAGRMLVAGFRQLSPGSSNAIVRLDGGGSVVVDLGTPHGRRIFAYGFCEPASRAMRWLLRPGDVVIDAGANIGLFTVLAAGHVGPEGRVIACEPSPTTMELLRQNVGQNDFAWVELREVALAEAPGRLQMHVFTPGSGYSSFAPADTGVSRPVEVLVTTLDDVAGDLLDRTRIVKLDIEGAELRALQGASRLLEHARPDFIVELEPDHLERQGSTVEDVRALFEDAAYSAYAIGEKGFEPLHETWGRPAGDPNIVVRPRERGRA
jgi:FkbM family methyltransferase